MIEVPISTNSAPVELSQLVKRFPSDNGETFTAVNYIDLKINAGELVTLLGPSGCGKTTTLRMLAGFEFPTSGNIFIGDKDVSMTPPNKRDVGMVFQSYALFPHLSVFENIAYGLKLKKLSKTEVLERTNRVIDLMHLDGFKDRLPAQLSGGQQQRVALARAIVTEPKVLLFDEPLSNLDAKLREYMREELRKLQQRLGITSLYVTHDQTEAMAISDKVVIMNKGEIQQADSPQNIYIRPKNHFVADFMGKANFIPSTVLDVQTKAVTIKLLENVITIDRNEFACNEGNEIDCVVRPEFWKIDEKGSFSGIVRRTTYFGNSVEYEVEFRGGIIITFTDYEHINNGIKFDGQEITLHLKKECVSLLDKRES